MIPMSGAEAGRDEVRASTWADAAATLNDHADVWERDGSDPCRVYICRELANAFRTYAEGVGVPPIDSLRQKRAAAEAERDELRAKVAAVEALANQRDVPYPPKFAFDATTNYVNGYRAMRDNLCAALTATTGEGQR